LKKRVGGQGNVWGDALCLRGAKKSKEKDKGGVVHRRGMGNIGGMEQVETKGRQEPEDQRLKHGFKKRKIRGYRTILPSEKGDWEGHSPMKSAIDGRNQKKYRSVIGGLVVKRKKGQKSMLL